eukprot:m.101307 g.101307  ORF g.101307 m.101307 type:complete len:516 (-) comp16801_c0_seq1:360-1907(-)
MKVYSVLLIFTSVSCVSAGHGTSSSSMSKGHSSHTQTSSMGKKDEIVSITFMYHANTECGGNLQGNIKSNGGKYWDLSFTNSSAALPASAVISTSDTGSTTVTVADGTTFTISAASQGEIGATTYIWLDNTNGERIGEVAVHTSCSAPIGKGDTFGFVTVHNLITSSGGSYCGGSSGTTSSCDGSGTAVTVSAAPTSAPSTAPPVVSQPQATNAPITSSPSVAPTSVAPTSAAPTSTAPTSAAPTSAAPTNDGFQGVVTQGQTTQDTATTGSSGGGGGPSVPDALCEVTMHQQLSDCGTSGTSSEAVLVEASVGYTTADCATHTTTITVISTDFYITVQPVCPDQSNPGAPQKWNICSWRPDDLQETILCGMLGMQCCLFVEDKLPSGAPAGVSCQEYEDGTCQEFYGIGIDGTTQIAALELQNCVGGIPANPQCKFGSLEAGKTTSSDSQDGAALGIVGVAVLCLALSMHLYRVRTAARASQGQGPSAATPLLDYSLTVVTETAARSDTTSGEL